MVVANSRVEIVPRPDESLVKGAAVSNPDRAQHRIGLTFRGGDARGAIVDNPSIRLYESVNIRCPAFFEHRNGARFIRGLRFALLATERVQQEDEGGYAGNGGSKRHWILLRFSKTS